MNHVLEARSGVIDELIGSQFAQEITIACRGGRNDLCAAQRALDGEDANAAGTSVDQDGLPATRLACSKRPCQAVRADSNRSGLHIIERAWFGSQFAR